MSSSMTRRSRPRSWSPRSTGSGSGRNSSRWNPSAKRSPGPWCHAQRGSRSCSRYAMRKADIAATFTQSLRRRLCHRPHLEERGDRLPVGRLHRRVGAFERLDAVCFATMVGATVLIYHLFHAFELAATSGRDPGACGAASLRRNPVGVDVLPEASVPRPNGGALDNQANGRRDGRPGAAVRRFGGTTNKPRSAACAQLEALR